MQTTLFSRVITAYQGLPVPSITGAVQQIKLVPLDTVHPAQTIEEPKRGDERGTVFVPMPKKDKLEQSQSQPQAQSQSVTKASLLNMPLSELAKGNLSVPAKQEPAKQEPAKQEPAKGNLSVPTKQEPAKQEPAKQEPAKQEPAKQEPTKQEPAKVVQAKVEVPPSLPKKPQTKQEAKPTLHHATKERPKVGTGRKPPTRKNKAQGEVQLPLPRKQTAAKPMDIRGSGPYDPPPQIPVRAGKRPRGTEMGHVSKEQIDNALAGKVEKVESVDSKKASGRTLPTPARKSQMIPSTNTNARSNTSSIEIEPAKPPKPANVVQVDTPSEPPKPTEGEEEAPKLPSRPSKPEPPVIIVQEPPSKPEHKAICTITSLFAYDTDEDGELSFAPGEVLDLLSEKTEHDGWWLARRGDVNGVVPLNFFSKGRVVRALFNYTEQEGGELSLAVGDLIQVIDGTPCEGWLNGKIGDRTGSFPENFVEELGPTSEKVAEIDEVEEIKQFEQSETEGEWTAGTRVVSLFDYEAADEGELTLRQGDELEVVSVSEHDGWMIGRLNGAMGQFPVNFCKRK